MTRKDAIRWNAACVALAGLASATTTATAEQLVHIDFGPHFDAPVNVSVLSGQFADQGVVFSAPTAPIIYWYGEDGQAAYPWVIHAGLLPGVHGPGGIEPIHIDFLVPVRSVAIRGLDGGGNVDTMLVRAFDAAGTLVDEQSITSNFAYPGHVAEVRGDIAEVVVQASGSTSGLFFDDLTFVQEATCETANGNDCNANGVPDECDVAHSCDVVDNGLPDWTVGPSLGSSMIACRFVCASDDFASSLHFRFAERTSLADLGPSVQWALLADAHGSPAGVLAEGTCLDIERNELGQGPGGARWVEGVIALESGLSLRADTAYWLGLYADAATEGGAVTWSSSVATSSESAVETSEVAGEWLATEVGGVSFKLVRMLEDCNGNGIPDECDIAEGISEDLNSDGMPDECQNLCPEDVDRSGEVGFSDLLAAIVAWGTCTGCDADIDDSSFVDFTDVLLILGAWGPCSGGDWERVPARDDHRIFDQDPAEILGMAEALERLEERDARKAEIVRLRYFGELKLDEIAALLGISTTLVKDELRFARAWLHRELGKGAARESTEGVPTA